MHVLSYVTTAGVSRLKVSYLSKIPLKEVNTAMSQLTKKGRVKCPSTSGVYRLTQPIRVATAKNV